MRRQRGAVAVLVALLLTVLTGLCGLAVDVAYGFLVRNELQNAADAAALSGAGHLYRDGSAPDWTAAAVAAGNAVQLNRSTNAILQDGAVQYGYWNLAGTSAELLVPPAIPGPGEVPAVMVTIGREEGSNGGPVTLFFASVLGIRPIPVRATAVAAVAAPSVVGDGVLFPLAVSACLYRTYWAATANPPGPRVDPATGSPYVFRIGPGSAHGACATGNWSSFGLDAADVAAMRSLLTGKNPASLRTGDAVWLQPAVDASIYGDADACSGRGNKTCETILVPVVENVGDHATDVITAFACLRVELASVGGSYVQVSMKSACMAPNSGGIGPDLGAHTSPRLSR
jgi:hypothetical protein